MSQEDGVRTGVLRSHHGQPQGIGHRQRVAQQHDLHLLGEARQDRSLHVHH